MSKPRNGFGDESFVGDIGESNGLEIGVSLHGLAGGLTDDSVIFASFSSLTTSMLSSSVECCLDPELCGRFCRL